MRPCSKRSFGEEMPSAEYFPVITVAGSLVIIPIFHITQQSQKLKKSRFQTRKKA